ncbi:MAG TPA: hypothetical protein VF275_07435 [Gammaproteobacteria bacterium]
MKNLSFRELSALGSALAVIFSAYAYFPDALWLSAAFSAGTTQGLERTDLVKFALGMVLLLIVIEVVYHVILAILMRSEAHEPADERDRLIGMKAVRIGYGVIVTGIVLLAGYLLTVDISGLVAVQYLLLVLFIGEGVRYASQFLLYRLGI